MLTPSTSRRRDAVLLLVALFGLLVPNVLFLYSLFHDYPTWQAALANRLALALLSDAFLATGLIAWWLARHPLGPVRWPWFVVMALIGGLGFALPFFLWLNERRAGSRSAGAGGARANAG